MKDLTNSQSIKHASVRLLALALIFGIVLSSNKFFVAKAQAQTPNYIFPNEVLAHGELGGGTANIVINSSGVQGDLIVRNYSDVWLTISARSLGGASYSSSDFFVNFGVLPPNGTISYRGDFNKIDQKIVVLAKYDGNAWLWNSADTILRLIPGGDSLPPSALGETLTAIEGLNYVQNAASELQKVKDDGWPSGLVHAFNAANELRKLATDDQQAALLVEILAKVSIHVSTEDLKDLLSVIKIYEELKHIADSLIFLIVAPDGASVEFEAKYYGMPPTPVPPPPPPRPSPQPKSDDAIFISDITIPDGTIVSPSQSLIKIWHLKNTGSSTWDSGYKLAFVDAEQMGAPISVDVSTTAPGQEVDINVSFSAPNQDGEHVSRWRLRNPQGTYFGPTIWIKVMVRGANPGGSITMFDVSPTSPSSTTSVHIVGRARYFSDFRSMRFVIGNEVHEMENIRQVGDQNEISFDWNTTSLPRGNYAIYFEVAKNGDSDWVSAERQVKTYALTGTSTSTNHPPDRPLLKSPYNWYLKDASGSPASVELCVNPVNDPDGDTVKYYFEVKDQGGGVYANSGWVSSACWPHSFDPNTYSWRVKSGDGSAESDWSTDTWNFTVAKGGVYIGDVSFFQQQTNETHICVMVTYDGIQAPDVYAWLNKQNDGSENGEWRLLDHYGPNTTPDCTQPNYHGFWIHSPEYTTGNHKLKITAVKRDSGSNQTKTTYYNINYLRPSDVQLLVPSTRTNNSTWWNARNIHFEWSASLRADSYTLRVSTNSNPWSDSTPILNQTLSGSVTSFDYVFSQDYPKLYWSVRANNSAGYTDSGPDVWFGVDTVKSTCQVQTLPAATYENVFQVNWSGTDDSSGVRSYGIQYLDSARGTWQDWLSDVTASKPYELFNGQPGHTYSFRCLATDNAGNNGAYSGNGDTSIKVDPAARPPAVWWNSAYSYKRNLIIQNNMPGMVLPIDYPVRLLFNTSTVPTAAEIYNASQSSMKCDDLRVVQNDSIELDRIIESCSSSVVEIRFQTKAQIPAGSLDNTDYQIYYGNSSAANPPANPINVWVPKKDSNTVGLWYLSEGTGNVSTDYSGMGNNITSIGSLTWTFNEKFGNALSNSNLSGGPPGAFVPGNSTLSSSTFTFEAFVKRNDLSYGIIAAQGESNYQRERWAISLQDGNLKLTVWPWPGAGASDFFSSQHYLPDTNWHHIAVTFDGSNGVKFYRDGTLTDSGSLSQNGINYINYNLYIGSGFQPSAERFNGIIDQVRFSNTVLTSFPHAAKALVTSEPSLAAGQIQTPPSVGSPDLAITDLFAFPYSQGGALIQAQIQNQGNLDTLNGFFTDVYVDHLPTGTGDYTGSVQFWVNDPIAAGQTVTLTTVITEVVGSSSAFLMPLTPSGEITRTLYAQVDSAGSLTESDESNNITLTDRETKEFVITGDEFDGMEESYFSISGDGFHNNWIGTDPSVMTGWIFEGVNIPKGAKILNAYLRMRGYGTGGNSTARITGFAEDDASVFTADGANKPSTRISTAAHVDWQNNWTFEWQYFQSPDISPIIQEIIDRIGWDTGHNLGLKATNPSGTGANWSVVDFAGGEGHDVKLFVTFTTSTPTQICFAAKDIFETDDDPSAASLIAVGESQFHNVDKSGDKDWVKFKTKAGVHYVIQTSGLGNLADTYLYLYDTDGTTLLASNDDYGGSLSSQIDWIAPTDGNYYILVQHWNSNAAGCGTTYYVSINGPRIFLPIVRK